MTKKEIIFWLEDKRNQKIGEKEAEAKEKQREIYKEVLAPLGFYEAASQIKEHLQQALEIWRGWKKTQGPTALGFAFRDYLGFEQQTIRWLEGEMPFEAFLEEHDIFLSPNLFQELNQEKGETIHNIHLTPPRAAVTSASLIWSPDSSSARRSEAPRGLCWMIPSTGLNSRRARTISLPSRTAPPLF
mgnify:CR=1 FL=1